jgi:hypothetical protein
MNRTLPALAITAVFLAGCAALSDNEKMMLSQRGVSQSLVDRMSHREPLDLDDVILLSRRNVPSSFVVRYIRSTSAVYQLNSSDVTRLRKAGVDRRVVDYMLATPRLAWEPYGVYHGPWYGPYPYAPWWGAPWPYYGPYYGPYYHWRHW